MSHTVITVTLTIIVPEGTERQAEKDLGPIYGTVAALKDGGARVAMLRSEATVH